MRNTTLTSILVVLTASAHAQTTLPAGYDTTDGGHYSYYLGAWQDAHIQILTGDLQGSSTRLSLASLALRRSQTPATNYARGWTNVTLTMANMDFARVSDTFSRNLMSNMTQVFSAKVSWPGHTGKPSSRPAPWGGFAKANDVVLTFTTPYIHAGKWGTCLDFRFRGGTLANAVPWGSSFLAYYHDGIATNHQSAGGSIMASPARLCSKAFFVAWLFSDRIPGGAQHRVQVYTQNGLATTSHIGVLGVGNGSSTGKPFAGSCHPLHLDLQKPAVMLPYTTDANGDFFSEFLTTPFLPALVGKSVWSQAAFASSGMFELTRVGQSPIAALPTGTPLKFGKRVYSFGATAQAQQAGSGPWDTLIPILRLK